MQNPGKAQCTGKRAQGHQRFQQHPPPPLASLRAEICIEASLTWPALPLWTKSHFENLRAPPHRETSNAEQQARLCSARSVQTEMECSVELPGPPQSTVPPGTTREAVYPALLFTATRTAMDKDARQGGPRYLRWLFKELKKLESDFCAHSVQPSLGPTDLAQFLALCQSRRKPTRAIVLITFCPRPLAPFWECEELGSENANRKKQRVWWRRARGWPKEAVSYWRRQYPSGHGPHAWFQNP